MQVRNCYDTRTGLFGWPPEEFRAFIITEHAEPTLVGHDPRNKRVDLNTLEVVDYQPPPPASDTVDATWEWDTGTQLWVANPTLEYSKREQAVRIKLAAKAEDQTDINISGTVLAADFESRAALFQKVQIAQMNVADGQAFSVNWQLVDETVVTLNANQVKAIVRAINTREDAIRAKAHTLLASIKSAANKADVLAIVWSFP